MSALDISDDQFASDVIKSDVPVVVDFYSTNCSPCKKLSPIIEELSREYSGKVKFVKINIDNHQQTAARFGIFAVPNLLFFKGGNRVDAIPQLVPKDQIKSRVDALLS